ncbi:MAG: S41 family peptidase [Vicinamibacteria bacterium]|nr:S41 family peptidase [Vicinamibacteria bacterium]
MRSMGLALAGALLLGPTTAAPVVAEGAELLTAEVRASVLDRVLERLNDTYVDPEAAGAIASAIRARREAHAYDGITNASQFGEAVTHDLRSMNGDLHLGLRYSPEASAPSRPASPFGDPRELNFGMGRAEILDGNVGYLEITGFTGGDYRDAVVDALRFLSRTDAMIIDVRRNGGGASDMSHFIFSHFLGEKPVPTIDVRSRRSSEPQHRFSLADVPGPRRPDVPLYLLTSQGTGSAAEEFSFVLKNLHRATIVGRRTAGAGHMVAQIPVGNGFTASLSVTRVSDPQTGLEWEQVGVQPDIAVDPEQALFAAHAAALKTVLTVTRDANRSPLLTRLLETVEARARGASPVGKSPNRLAGAYEGRAVAVRAGQLWYSRRAGGLSEPLVFLGEDRYALGAQRLRFAESGGIMALTVEQADGTQLTFRRSVASR